MPSAFDRFMPKIQMQFPDGGVLSIGTMACDDQIHQAVYLAYTRAGSSAPILELQLPPKSVEVIIQQLQEHANQARLINGERMLEYPEPYPVARPGSSWRARKARQHKKTTGQQRAAQSGGPAMPPGNAGVTDGPPSVG